MYAPKLDKQANNLINQAHYGSARLRDLVNDMLNVARMESGKNDFLLEPLEVKPIIKDVLSTMSVVAKINDIKLKYDEKVAGHVVADEGRYRILINNFVSNAIKYNKPSGTVRVYHQIKDGQLVTAIEDNGLGIPDEQKNHMFEKFFRVDHEDRKSVSGSGLGMYIAKQYVEQMGGKLWFDSVHGKGTTFYFSLPYAKVTVGHKLKSKIKRAVPKRRRRTKLKKS